MRIPSRVEVLSWNENEVADLLREHKLLDCVDCVFQRHIDGQKLLNLKEGDVKYFLEIHDERSREKFWNIVKKILEKRGSGVGNLMRNFQTAPEWNNNTAKESVSDCGSDVSEDSDSFSDSDYDEPDEESEVPHKPSVSLERRETITRNLAQLFSNSPPVTSNMNDEVSTYPEPEDIYDVPEDGCGEPEELYDTPSDESGGGVVTRHPAVERQESQQYLVPDDRNLIEIQQTPDDEDYELLNGAPPPMGHSPDMQEEYVVPDTKPAAVPPRPPKSTNVDHKPAWSSPTMNGHRKAVGNKNKVQQLQSSFEEQESYEPPPPHRSMKKPALNKPNLHPPVPQPSKPQARKDEPKPPTQPPRIPTKSAVKPPVVPYEQEDYEFPQLPPSTGKKPTAKPLPTFVQEDYEPPPVQPLRPTGKKTAAKPPPAVVQEDYEPPPVQPLRPTGKKTAAKPPPAVVQEDYEPPPVQPLRPSKQPNNLKKPAKPPQKDKRQSSDQPRYPKKAPIMPKPPVEQENYEAPEMPERPAKTPQEPLAQENYEPPQPRRKSKPAIAIVADEPEDEYEDPNQSLTMTRNTAGSVDEQEEYEVPDNPSSAPPPTASPPQVSPPQTSPKKSAFSTIKNLARNASKKNVNGVIPKQEKKKPNKNEIPNKPALPDSHPVTDNPQQPYRQPPTPAGKKFRGDRSTNPLPSLPTGSSGSPSLPPKPCSPKTTPRRKPEPVPSKPKLKKSVQDQPWFHGSISKTAVAEMLKSTKKDGAYLVRNSSQNAGKYIMSILYKNEIRHLHIPCENEQYRLGDSGTERFLSIDELVSYFLKHDVEFSAGGKTALTQACCR